MNEEELSVGDLGGKAPTLALSQERGALLRDEDFASLYSARLREYKTALKTRLIP